MSTRYDKTNHIQPVALLKVEVKVKDSILYDDNKRAAACQRSKLVFKTLSLQPLLGLRGGSPGGFHDPRLSSSDGMGYTLHCAGTGCTVNWTKYNTDWQVHCIAALPCQGATESCPLPLLLQCDVSRVYSSIRRTGTQQQQQQQCTELQCTEKALISTALHCTGHHCTE